ncbi:MAG TPA: aminodeoxychorismate/anthranilate synthase component II [Cytophagaceae bacterium]
MGPTILIIDNYDSFTFNLVDYFTQLGAICIVKRNDVPLSEILELQFDSIVLSPGPGKPSEAGISLLILGHFYRSKPILGICLGHQAIGEFFGANLKKALKPMHGKLSEVISRPHSIFYNVPGRFRVVRYHSLKIDQLPACLENLAQTLEGEIMAVAHKDLPIIGIQYHPEAYLTEYGLQIVKNWIGMSTKK